MVIEHEGQTTQLEVEPGETILAKALDSGLSVIHDCKLGVCMTCPAQLFSGSVDQSDGMLSDDVVERGSMTPFQSLDYKISFYKSLGQLRT